ncbi:hypothetical protein SEA_VINCENZO_76 [Mycobacterium phage Vincenzo]|uniref:Uncharacterized protein n=2 Tax=Coopervirus vincenzo TaxID=1983110 RepID=A0A0F6WE11_9CAUD|nr:hypothetical protein SEA_VINCENZO_76 [Mycobacterium phage Vincenzo]AKF14338.1 hypothetical protein SEA_VINCENZO_76 [Mycobacterium phage Vincenzo]AKF14742.1 hypothetical protein SEA_ALANGRANT_77 [Mycobacterium phage AlanGrant]
MAKTKARKGTRRAGALRGGTRKIARSRRPGTIALHAKAGGIATFAKGGGGGYRGFKSKKQWRWAWATKQPWARKKSHETAGGPKVRYRRLPASKHSGHKGTRRPKS